MEEDMGASASQTGLSSQATEPASRLGSNELQSLARRCEEATGSDRGLDAQLGRALRRDGKAKNIYQRGCYRGGKPVLLRVDYVFPPYTASLDAAMTLVPAPDWEWSLEIETGSDGEMFARCAMGDPARFRDVEAKTPALALCAAALRARDTDRNP
jgi:hypothetical protein